MTTNDSWVYFANCKGFTKIGISRMPWTRIREAHTFSPFEIELYHFFYVGDNHWVEKEFHNLFIDKKHRNEWFVLNKKELKAIKDYFDTGDINNPQKLKKSEFKYFIKLYKSRILKVKEKRSNNIR